MVAIAKEHLSLDAPMIVDEIRIIEVDAPALALWRETTQEEHFGMFWQKGDEWMILYPTLTTLYVLSVQITLHHYS
jgi:hypothetical protein